jgi:hypothetical protein
MAFTIHAFRDGHFMKTLRLQPRGAAERAQNLLDKGWRVHVTDETGRQYSFDAPEGLEVAETHRSDSLSEIHESAASS